MTDSFLCAEPSYVGIFSQKFDFFVLTPSFTCAGLTFDLEEFGLFGIAGEENFTLMRDYVVDEERPNAESPCIFYTSEEVGGEQYLAVAICKGGNKSCEEIIYECSYSELRK